jgi:hypothetical protein
MFRVRRTPLEKDKMKRSIALAAALAIAPAAFANLGGETPSPWTGSLEALSINLAGEFVSTFAPGDERYNAVPGPYAALPAGDGLRGFNYYETSSPGGPMFLGEMRFVGGTNTVGGSVTFNFFNWAGVVGEIGDLVNSFSVTLPQAGDFTWTITLGEGFVIPTLGYVQMVNGTGGLSRWFLTNTAPTVGTSFGSPFEANPSQAFALIEGVPAPGAIALLGMAGLLGSRRRR